MNQLGLSFGERPATHVASPLASFDRPSFNWQVLRYTPGSARPVKVEGSERKSYAAAAALAERLDKEI